MMTKQQLAALAQAAIMSGARVQRVASGERAMSEHEMYERITNDIPSTPRVSDEQRAEQRAQSAYERSMIRAGVLA